MLILGIDPGSRRTGWGLVRRDGTATHYVASGTWRLPERESLAVRLYRLAEGLEDVVTTHTPQHCAIESIFTARNARSALVLGHARGVVLCTLARAGLTPHEYTPMQVKQAVSGVGGADKTQVERMVRLLLGRHEPLQEDEADALAVALTHAAALPVARRAP